MTTAGRIFNRKYIHSCGGMKLTGNGKYAILCCIVFMHISLNKNGFEEVNMEHQNGKFEIDLVDLFYYLKKRVWIVVVAALLAMGGSFLYEHLFATPVYAAEARMYVLNRSDENNVGSADFQISNYMLNDYKVLITGRNVTQKVVEQLGLNMTPNALKKKIQVTAPTNTRVLQITVTDTDPQHAADIANAVYEVAAEQIQAIMAVDAVQLVYAAEVPRVPVGSTGWRIARRAAIIVASIVLLTLFLVYVLDDTLRTEEDVERHLGLPTIGVIPDSVDMRMGTDETQTSKKKFFGKRVVGGR